jgi:hypothetical protein
MLQQKVIDLLSEVVLRTTLNLRPNSSSFCHFFTVQDTVDFLSVLEYMIIS